MWANSPGAELLRTISKFTKREIISSSPVHVFHKTWKQAFLRSSRKVTTKKCTKKRDISVKLLFCSLNVLNFRHSLRCRCRQIFLRSLYYIWELSVVLLESKKETFKYEYNDYSKDNFLIQIFQLFLLIHLGPVVRVFKYLFFKGINFSLLLLRWLNPVLAVCEYTVKFRKYAPPCISPPNR